MPNLPVYDGFSTLQGGMNGGVLNTLIADNQFARGVNVACRNGTLSTRPQLIEVVLESADPDVVYNIQHGKFQGMYYYQYEDNNYIAFAFNGSIYLIDPVVETIWDMTAIIGPMSAAVDRLHFCQVERYLVVQDGTNTPVIIEDTASRLAVPGDDEVPVGTIMAYCHGGLFIKTGADQFIAGNIYMPNAPGNVLVFTEVQYLAGGGAFFTPADLGQITALSWAQAYGEATGDGPLLALCERGIASFRVSVPRLQWQDMAIMKIEPGGNGNASEYCVVRLNEDLLFMSWNGIQDFALLNTESATRHRLTNLNSEVKPILDLESPTLRRLAIGCKFDDRLLYTVIGEECTAICDAEEVIDYRFNALLALDFSPNNGISSLGSIAKPAYDGVWTGWHPLGICSGIFNFEEMCFTFGKDNDGVNHLYRLMKRQGNDMTEEASVPIQCRLYTRGLPFVAYDKDYPRPVPQYEKILYDASLWISAFQGDVDFGLYTCPDFSSMFNLVSTIQVRAPMATDDTPPVSGYSQARSKEKFPAFSQNACQPITGKSAIRGFEFQFMLEWAGVANITKLMIAAEAHKEVISMDCATNDKVLIETPPNDFLYDIND